MSSEDTQSKKLVRFYLRSIICVGGLTYFLAAYQLDLKIVDLQVRCPGHYYGPNQLANDNQDSSVWFLDLGFRYVYFSHAVALRL